MLTVVRYSGHYNLILRTIQYYIPKLSYSNDIQHTCKNNALSSKILEVKSDRFLLKMYGSSTGVTIELSFRTQ